MIRVIIHGCSGRMGHIITDICEKEETVQVVAGVDAFGGAYAGYPVYRTLSECPEADVVIDFSTASAIDNLLAYCVGKKIAAVICTTGLSEEQLQAVSGDSWCSDHCSSYCPDFCGKDSSCVDKCQYGSCDTLCLKIQS